MSFKKCRCYAPIIFMDFNLKNCRCPLVKVSPKIIKTMTKHTVTIYYTSNQHNSLKISIGRPMKNNFSNRPIIIIGRFETTRFETLHKSLHSNICTVFPLPKIYSLKCTVIRNIYFFTYFTCQQMCLSRIEPFKTNCCGAHR